MKTIDKAAKHHADTFTPANDRLMNVTGQDINDYVYSAFEDVAKFAQQWTSVKQTLPQPERDSGLSKPVLVNSIRTENFPWQGIITILTGLFTANVYLEPVKFWRGEKLN